MPPDGRHEPPTSKSRLMLPYQTPSHWHLPTYRILSRSKRGKANSPRANSLMVPLPESDPLFASFPSQTLFTITVTKPTSTAGAGRACPAACHARQCSRCAASVICNLLLLRKRGVLRKVAPSGPKGGPPLGRGPPDCWWQTAGGVTDLHRSAALRCLRSQGPKIRHLQILEWRPVARFSREA